MADADVVTARSEGVLTITLNRPAALNALSRSLREALKDALDAAARDEEVGAVVLTGAGRAFCVGQDVQELSQLYEEGGTLGELVEEEYVPLLRRLHSLPKPVVAAVHGPAAGGGMALALAADVRLASRQASFLPAFVRVGLAPDSGCSYYLVQMLGLAKAMEVALLGEAIAADEALRLGLVRGVLESQDELLGKAQELAARLAAGPRLAYAAIKECLHAAAGTYEAVVARESQAQARLGRTEDHREAVAAFLERRAPRFSGR